MTLCKINNPLQQPDLPPEVRQKPHQHEVAIQLRDQIYFFQRTIVYLKIISRDMKQPLTKEGAKLAGSELEQNEWNLFERCGSTNLLQSWNAS